MRARASALQHFTSQNVVVRGNDAANGAWCGVYQLTHQERVCGRLAGAGRAGGIHQRARDDAFCPVYLLALLLYDTFFAVRRASLVLTNNRCDNALVVTRQGPRMKRSSGLSSTLKSHSLRSAPLPFSWLIAFAGLRKQPPRLVGLRCQEQGCDRRLLLHLKASRLVPSLCCCQ